MSEKEFTDEHELIKAITNLALNPHSLISIDGVDGVGKSTLANKIKAKLSTHYIELDTFVQEQKGGYIEYLDYDKLQDEIGHLMTTNALIVIEGICIQQVLKRTGLTSDLSIYVKVIDGNNFWMDQFRFFPSGKSAEEVIEDRKSKKFSLGHTEEIIRYHYRFKPHKTSDWIFVRYEQ